MSTTQTPAPAVAVKPMDALKNVLNAPSVQDQFRNALGAHKDTFVASLIDLFGGDKQLQTCAPGAVVAEALRAATLNFPLTKALGFAYIVVFNNSVRQPDGTWIKVPTPTFVLGYKGYIQMAMRTGQYKTINADVVYEGEIKGVEKLSGRIIFGGTPTSNKIVGYFCHFELLNGFTKTLYMSVKEMAEYAKKYSPSVRKETTAEDLEKKANETAAGRKAVGWEGNFNDMAIKTVVRRLLSKYGYLSVEMQNVLAKEVESESRDEMIEQGANQTELNLDEIPFEEVNTETGEIAPKEAKESAGDTPAPLADEEPNF